MIVLKEKKNFVLILSCALIQWISALNSPLPPDVKDHKNLKLLPTNCGYFLEDRIYNGGKTEPLDFPWMVLLSYKSGEVKNFRCAGTIINEQYILTSAHCISNNSIPEKVQLESVRVGDHNVETETDCASFDGQSICSPPSKDILIEKYIPHEKYVAGKIIDYDIGLLKLKEKIDLTKENTKPICLPVDTAKYFNVSNSKGVVTGWRDIETGELVPELVKATLDIVPLEQCIESYNKIRKIPLNHKHLCVGGNNRGLCGGDGGGPLQIVDRDDIKYVQKGIVSFGPRRCATPEIPAVYTNVIYYMDWILDNLEP